MTALLRGREKGYFKKNLWRFYWPPALQGVPHFCLNTSGLWCCWPQRPLCHAQSWGCWSFGRIAWNCCYSGHHQDQSPPLLPAGSGSNLSLQLALDVQQDLRLLGMVLLSARVGDSSDPSCSRIPLSCSVCMAWQVSTSLSPQISHGV